MAWPRRVLLPFHSSGQGGHREPHRAEHSDWLGGTDGKKSQQTATGHLSPPRLKVAAKSLCTWAQPHCSQCWSGAAAGSAGGAAASSICPPLPTAAPPSPSRAREHPQTEVQDSICPTYSQSQVTRQLLAGLTGKGRELSAGCRGERRHAHFCQVRRSLPEVGRIPRREIVSRNGGGGVPRTPFDPTMPDASLIPGFFVLFCFVCYISQ